MAAAAEPEARHLTNECGADHFRPVVLRFSMLYHTSSASINIYGSESIKELTTRCSRMLRNVGATFALVVPAVVTTVLASSTNCLVALDA